MIYLTDDFMKRRCDVVKSGWSTKQVPLQGFFWCFNRRAIKKRRREEKEKEEKRRKKKEEKGGKRRRKEGKKFISLFLISKSSRRATPTMANYHRCGLMGRIRWLPSERACVDEWVPSWISSEGCYQVSSHWHDGVIILADNIRQGLNEMMYTCCGLWG